MNKTLTATASAEPTTPMPIISLEPLLTTQELADYLQVPLKTVYDWNFKKAGPVGIKVGRGLRFRPSAVAAWLDGNTMVAVAA